MRHLTFIGLLTGLVLTTMAGIRRDDINKPANLTVHEWGTFTSVAGQDGRAVEWRALAGATDLPCFVNRLGSQGWINKLTLMAKVRMETPVLYFYAPHEMTASAKVQFRDGVMTEWYPKATTRLGRTPDEVDALAWNDVQVLPQSNAVFPTEPGESHYYTARNTEAAPLHLNDQDEKFLFYRGVGNFQPPVAVRLSDGKVVIENLGTEPIPFAILFENRDGKIRFRDVKDISRSVTLDASELNAYPNNLWVRDVLSKMLVVSGLYGKEAQAMVDTWRDSWFEEGTRVFYIVPQGAVDSILPLGIQPKPAQVSRVFVGRVELITQAMQDAVATAVRDNDQDRINNYGRFLAPTLERLIKSADGEERARFQSVLTHETDKVFRADVRCK
jgi:hypothetical protein